MFHRYSFGLARHHERIFGRGDFKYVLLDLLKDGPRHGYEMIRALEDQSHGFYAPSPGTVYPTLQMLEEMGCVAVSQQDGKKVYAINDEGRKLLAEHGRVAEDVRGRMHRWWGSHAGGDLHEARHELWEIWRGVSGYARGAQPERLRRIRRIISNARRDIEAAMEEE